MMFSVLLPKPMTGRSERRSSTVRRCIIRTSVEVIPRRWSSFKRITAAHDLIKSPERRAAYDRHLCVRRQQVRWQWKITIAGWTISAVISAGAVGVILPNLVKSVQRGSNVNGSLLTESFAHQLEAIVATTTEDARTGGTQTMAWHKGLIAARQ